METQEIGKGSGLVRRAARSRFVLVIVAMVPVLLIGYSLGASIMAPETDMSLVLSALLITGVGGFVIGDTLLARWQPVGAMRPVRILRQPRGIRR
jgi:hypothetical protein